MLSTVLQLECKHMHTHAALLVHQPVLESVELDTLNLISQLVWFFFWGGEGCKGQETHGEEWGIPRDRCVMSAYKLERLH